MDLIGEVKRSASALSYCTLTFRGGREVPSHMVECRMLRYFGGAERHWEVVLDSKVGVWGLLSHLED